MAVDLFLGARLVVASCALSARGKVGEWKGNAYRIFTVSKGCVAVTAPQAAMPPAMNALYAFFSSCFTLPEL